MVREYNVIRSRIIVPPMINRVAVAPTIPAIHIISLVTSGDILFVFRSSKTNPHNKSVGNEKPNPNATNKGNIVTSSMLKRSRTKLQRHNSNGANTIVEAQSFKRYNLFI